MANYSIIELKCAKRITSILDANVVQHHVYINRLCLLLNDEIDMCLYVDYFKFVSVQLTEHVKPVQ